MFSLMNDFQSVSSELNAWVMFVMIMICGGVLTSTMNLIFSDKRDTYYHGQIDAIRGIIKWRLERNEDGEDVWVKIKNDE